MAWDSYVHKKMAWDTSSSDWTDSDDSGWGTDDDKKTNSGPEYGQLKEPIINYKKWRVDTSRPSQQGFLFDEKKFQELIAQAQSHIRKILGTCGSATTDCTHEYNNA